MSRLKPPASQRQEMPILEDPTPPTEPIEIDLEGDEPGLTEVELAPRPEPAPEPAPVEPEPEPSPLAGQVAAAARADELQRANAAMAAQLRERDEQLAKERGRGDDAEYNSVLTAIAAEQATLDKAEADYAGYAANGNWAEAAKAQRILGMASARLAGLEDGKGAFEQRREAAKVAPPERRTAPDAPLNFEQRIENMPDTAKSWLRKHPEFINDPALTNKIGAAHTYLTTNRGVEAFSTSYFDALDQEFGFKAAPVTTEQPQRRSTPVSAPVSRDVPTANGQRQPSTKVTLNEEERRIARTSFTATDMTNAQKEHLYAQNKRKLQMKRANGEYPMPERN